MFSSSQNEPNQGHDLCVLHEPLSTPEEATIRPWGGGCTSSTAPGWMSTTAQTRPRPRPGEANTCLSGDAKTTRKTIGEVALRVRGERHKTPREDHAIYPSAHRTRGGWDRFKMTPPLKD